MVVVLLVVVHSSRQNKCGMAIYLETKTRFYSLLFPASEPLAGLPHTTQREESPLVLKPGLDSGLSEIRNPVVLFAIAELTSSE